MFATNRPTSDAHRTWWQRKSPHECGVFGRLVAHVSLTEKLGRLRSAVRSFPFHSSEIHALSRTLFPLPAVSHSVSCQFAVSTRPRAMRPLNWIHFPLCRSHLSGTLIFLPILQGTARLLRRKFRRPGSKPAGPAIPQGDFDVGARSGILQAFDHGSMRPQTSCTSTSFGEGVGVISSIRKFLVSACFTRLRHLSSLLIVSGFM